MATKEETEKFLESFRQKAKVYDIIFRDDREKNLQTLAELDISPFYRKSIILKLKASDYSQGPLTDTLYHLSDMWVFGKEVKGKEVYVKISMGSPK